MIDAVWREQIHHGLELHPLGVGGRSNLDAGKACEYAGDQEPEHGEQEPHANTEGDCGALVAGVGRCQQRDARVPGHHQSRGPQENHAIAQGRPRPGADSNDEHRHHGEQQNGEGGHHEVAGRDDRRLPSAAHAATEVDFKHA